MIRRCALVRGYYWGWTLRFQKYIPSSFLPAICGCRHRTLSYSSSTISVCESPGFLTWWQRTNPLKLSFIKLLWSWCLFTAIEYWLKQCSYFSPLCSTTQHICFYINSMLSLLQCSITYLEVGYYASRIALCLHFLYKVQDFFPSFANTIIGVKIHLLLHGSPYD